MTAARLFAADESATLALGARLARALRAGDCIHLHGDLGAGKTTLARGLLQALRPGQRVKSPTYALVENYDLAQFPLLHLDLYRLGDPAELEYLGVREHAGRAAWLIEWPQRAAFAVPPADLRIDLALRGAGRDVLVQPLTLRGEQLARAAVDLDAP
jgi:tRNA threonylcarbamoyladenosine biosynthesis protein TsaE